jgi:hypothetical protein
MQASSAAYRLSEVNKRSRLGTEKPSLAAGMNFHDLAAAKSWLSAAVSPWVGWTSYTLPAESMTNSRLT